MNIFSDVIFYSFLIICLSISYILKIFSIKFRATVASYIARKLTGRPIMIGVEGLIGAGKTTFLNSFRNKNITILTEPIDLWQNLTTGLVNDKVIADSFEEKDKNLMQKFDKEPQRYSYSFQSLVYITKISNIIEALKSKFSSSFILIERTCLCDKLIFANMLFENKVMDPTEWLTHSHWYEKTMNIFELVPNGIIYLSVDPNCAASRVNKRARNEEKNLVNLDYLNNLYKYHESWLNYKKELYFGKFKYLVDKIDWSKDFDNPSQQALAYENKLYNMVYSISIEIILKYFKFY